MEQKITSSIKSNIYGGDQMQASSITVSSRILILLELFCHSLATTISPLYPIHVAMLHLLSFCHILATFCHTGPSRILGQGKYICSYFLTFWQTNRHTGTHCHYFLSFTDLLKEVTIFRHTHFSSLAGGSNRPIKRNWLFFVTHTFRHWRGDPTDL